MPLLPEAFDRKWKLRFDVLADSNQPHTAAAYASQVVFGQRQRLIQHMIACTLPEADRWRRNCLDIGCNAGFLSKTLNDTGLNVTGVDYSFRQLVAAKASYPMIPLLNADAYALPFRDDSFDCAASLGLLQCINDWQTTLREMLRVLKPGGIGLMETNRVFPLTERLLRSASYFVRGCMSPREVQEFFRSYSERSQGRLPEDLTPRKFSPRLITDYLLQNGVRNIVIHDSTRLGCFHDFVWGLVFTKPKNEPTACGCATIRHCQACYVSPPRLTARQTNEH